MKKIDKPSGKKIEEKIAKEYDILVKESILNETVDEEHEYVKKELMKKTYESAVKEIDELLKKLEQEKKEENRSSEKYKGNYILDIDMIE
ncbi:hypothetical protein KY342_04270 [Candidatus Woesearchaeota archaeon]|nr:hypothetical protein [Candidatus Woesearchaeota archaeon]